MRHSKSLGFLSLSVLLLAACGFAYANEFRIQALNQPNTPLTFARLSAADNKEKGTLDLSFTLDNSSADNLRVVQLAIFYFGEDGKITGGQGNRLYISNFVKTPSGGFAGTIVLAKNLAKNAKWIVVGLREVQGDRTDWRQSNEQVLNQLHDFQPQPTAVVIVPVWSQL